MTVLRRTFLKSAALTALSAAFIVRSAGFALGQDLTKQNPALDFQVPHAAKLDPVFSYTSATFEPYVGGIFRSRARGHWVRLKLVSVRRYEPKPETKILTKKARETDSFSLLFSANEPLSEITTIHELEHGALGKFALFLTPFEDDRGRLFYEAVINHAL